MSVPGRALYDVRGRLVHVLDDEQRAPGVHEVAWSPDHDRVALRSGVYFLRMQDGRTNESAKLVFLAR